MLCSTLGRQFWARSSVLRKVLDFAPICAYSGEVKSMAEAFTSDSLSSGGAESKEYRRKRAWRKPREPVTPEMGSDEKERVSTARPIKLRRDEASISGATSGSFSSSTSKCKDTLVTTEVKDVCVASVETVDMKGGLPLIMIDGSIMEGVRKFLLICTNIALQMGINKFL